MRRISPPPASAAFFVSSTNVLYSTNAGNSAANGLWAWTGSGYTNRETLAYRNFIGGQWSTYTNGIELYRGTNGAALGVTDTPIGGTAPGPGFAFSGYFSPKGYMVAPLISTNGSILYNNTLGGVVLGGSFGGTFTGGHSGSGASLTWPAGTFALSNLAAGNLPATVTNTAPILPSQIYGRSPSRSRRTT